MYRQIRHFYYLTFSTAWLLLAFAQAARYFKSRALLDLSIPNPDSLTSKERRRMKHYFYGTTYLSILFGMLRGKTRTTEEKHLFTNLAALAHFFDDLSDAYRAHDLDEVAWQNNPEKYGAIADERGLALHLLQNIYKVLPKANLIEFKEYMHRVFNLEAAGRQSKGENLDPSDLWKLTQEKGGCSVLLFRRVLAQPISPAEKNAWFEFGGLIQLCDDIFDLWFDHQDGTRTLAYHFYEKKDMQGLSAYFEKTVAQTYTALRATHFPGKHYETCIRGMHYIVCITRVCLLHYKDLEKKQGQLPITDRHQMVVDMEKWRNRVRAAWVLLKAC